jgi:hypothetical protein
MVSKIGFVKSVQQVIWAFQLYALRILTIIFIPNSQRQVFIASKHEKFISIDIRLQAQRHFGSSAYELVRAQKSVVKVWTNMCGISVSLSPLSDSEAESEVSWSFLNDRVAMAEL